MIRLHRVLITAPWFTKRHLESLEERFEVTANTKTRWFTEDELVGMIGGYDAVIAGLDPFTDRVIAEAGRLRIIARRGIGYDKVDLAACKRRGIFVTNTPVPEEHQAVAEFTVALLLDVCKNVTRSANSLRSGSWERGAFLGRNIEGMTVGVVGLGNIGRRVAKILSGFGAQVIYHDPYVHSSEFKGVGLQELFSSADAVSVNLVKTDETQGLITPELLGSMKPGSFLVNTSRPEVLVPGALKRAVEGGRLTVGLDVFDREPPEDDPLLGFESVLPTPHVGAYSAEAFDAIDRTCVSNVVKVLEGAKPEYVVNP